MVVAKLILACGNLIIDWISDLDKVLVEEAMAFPTRIIGFSTNYPVNLQLKSTFTKLVCTLQIGGMDEVLEL